MKIYYDFNISFLIDFDRSLSQLSPIVGYSWEEKDWNVEIIDNITDENG